MSAAAEPEGSALRGSALPADENREAPARSLTGSAVYAFGFAVQRAIGIVMLPLYTRAISPPEYGALGVMLSVYVALGVLFGAGLEASVVRDYFQLRSQPERRQRLMDSIWRFLVVYPLAASLLLAAIAWPLMGDGEYVGPLEIALMLFAAAVNTSATALPLALLRARQRLPRLPVDGIGHRRLTPTLTVLFVVALDQGIRGWFIAGLIANAATLATAMRVVPWTWGGRIHWPLVWGALLFSLPLVPHFLSHWALQLADRSVIAGHGDRRQSSGPTPLPRSSLRR